MPVHACETISPLTWGNVACLWLLSRCGYARKWKLNSFVNVNWFFFTLEVLLINYWFLFFFFINETTKLSNKIRSESYFLILIFEWSFLLVSRILINLLWTYSGSVGFLLMIRSVPVQRPSSYYGTGPSMFKEIKVGKEPLLLSVGWVIHVLSSVQSPLFTCIRVKVTLWWGTGWPWLVNGPHSSYQS